MTEEFSLDGVLTGIGLLPLPDNVDFDNIDIPELTPSEDLERAMYITKRSQGSIDMASMRILTPNEMGNEEVPRYYNVLAREFGENNMFTRRFKQQAQDRGIELKYSEQVD